jgi:hypothetical protein
MLLILNCQVCEKELHRQIINPGEINSRGELIIAVPRCETCLSQRERASYQICLQEYDQMQ